MQINILREYIELSKNLNFSKTAQQLYITQPVLSKHIALLEKEVGASLLIRSHHKVGLTDIGKIFLEEAIAIVKRYDEGMERVKTALNGIEKELKVGYLYEHAKEIVASTAQQFYKDYPNTNLILIASIYEELPRKLKEDEVDIIITLDLDKEVRSLCNTMLLYEDHLCVAINKDHPLAKEKSIDMQWLKKERIILPSEEQLCGYAKFVNDFLEKKVLKKKTLSYMNVSILQW